MTNGYSGRRPEHFDHAVAVDLDGEAVNVGFSPGDANMPEPYVYVGPHDTADLDGGYWNAPFGAVLSHADLRAPRMPTPSRPGSSTRGCGCSPRAARHNGEPIANRRRPAPEHIVNARLLSPRC